LKYTNGLFLDYFRDGGIVPEMVRSESRDSDYALPEAADQFE